MAGIMIKAGGRLHAQLGLDRLADGNDDDSPRHLLQLFHTVTAWEQIERGTE
jgi:hypothetical protein